MISREKILRLKDQISTSIGENDLVNVHPFLTEIIRQAMINVDLAPPSMDDLEQKVESFLPDFEKGLSDGNTEDAIKSSFNARVCYLCMKTL
jgi:hypothetical protein